MGCCGQRRNAREELRAADSSVAAGAGTRWATTHVRYLRREALRFVGPESRCLYEFSGLHDAQPVYRMDLPYLLRSGLFEPA